MFNIAQTQVPVAGTIKPLAPDLAPTLCPLIVVGHFSGKDTVSVSQIKTLDSECPRCKKPMVWHSMQTIGPQEVAVFECKACKRLKAVAAKPADVVSMWA